MHLMRLDLKCIDSEVNCSCSSSSGSSNGSIKYGQQDGSSFMAFANVNTLKILMIQANCYRDKRLNGQLGNRLVRQTEKERETERDKRFIIVVVVFKFISSLRFLCGFDPPQASSAQRFLVCLSHRMPFPLH